VDEQTERERLLTWIRRHLHRLFAFDLTLSEGVMLNGEERVSGSREDAEREDGVARAAHSSLLTITMLPTGSGVSKMRSQERLVDAGEKARQGLSK